MDNAFISRQEHEEFAKRMEEEHRRQNHRIGELEESTKRNNKLLISVEKLALNMENMQKEQQAQREEIEDLKSQPGKRWQEVTKYVVTAVIGILIGYVLKQIGIV